MSALHAGTAFVLLVLAGFSGALVPAPGVPVRAERADGESKPSHDPAALAEGGSEESRGGLPSSLPSPVVAAPLRTARPIPSDADAVRPPAAIEATPAAIALASPIAETTPDEAADPAPEMLVAAAAPAAQTEAPDPPEKAVAAGASTRSVTLLDGVATEPSNVPFRDGESLTYTATWTGISVGDATMTVDTGGTFEGRPAIHLKATASSGRAFSLFFSIKDAGESWVDPDGLFSLGFVSDQKEGGLEDYQKWVMDYDKGVATRHRARRKDGGVVKNTSKDYALSHTYVQDAFSMTYFFRAFPIKMGSKLESDVFVSKKVWKLTVEVIGQEKVKVPAGTFDCLKVKPTVSLNGEVQNKGQMVIWVTNDERKLPVKIQSDVALGKVNAVLTKFKEGSTQ